MADSVDQIRDSMIIPKAAAIKADENLANYLLRTSDPKLPGEDIALGDKQLLGVEGGWRDLKRVIDLRPVYHRNEAAGSGEQRNHHRRHSRQPRARDTHARPTGSRPGQPVPAENDVPAKT